MNESTINLMKAADRYLGIPVLYGLRLLKPILGPSPPASPEIRTILMVKLWGIGNLVMILPLIRAVRNRYPRASLHFLTLKCNEELLENAGYLDGLITFQPKGLSGTGFDLLRILGKLRGLQPDLVLDFEQFLRVTAILARLSGAAQVHGFRTEGQARAVLYNGKVPYRKDRHMSLAFGDIVRSAGISTHGLPPLEAPRSKQAAVRADEFIRSLPGGDGPIVALHPGSGDNFPGRRWPVENFATLAARLFHERGARLVVTGTEPERELAEHCMKEADVPMTSSVGRLDIMAFIEFLARVDLLVTNDTAPAHIGSALGTPLIAIYGPNTPDLYGPLHPSSRVFFKRLPCSPCLTNMNAKTSRCRLPSCILGIEPSEVLQTALEMLTPSCAGESQRQEGDTG